MPAYFWMYNLYALERNSWKSKKRDKRNIKIQQIESDYLTPDSVEEIISALEKLEAWMKQAGRSFSQETIFSMNEKSSNYLEDPEYSLSASANEMIYVQGLERSKRKTVILKPARAFTAYREMLFYYCFKTIANYLIEYPLCTFDEMLNQINILDDRVCKWENFGGQIIPSFRIDMLREKIKSGAINNWHDVHAFYDEAANQYALDKLCHAYSVLKFLGYKNITNDEFCLALNNLIKMQSWMFDQVYKSRARDFIDPFRRITYRNENEMEAVVGKAEDNLFIRQMAKKSDEYITSIEKLIERL
jgi:hypothetical protein